MQKAALLAALAALVALGAAQAATAPVRLVAQPPVTRGALVDLVGTIAAAGPNEQVIIEERWCGQRVWMRPVTAHMHGRSFDLQVLPTIRTTYRARWRDHVSEPVTVRVHPEVRFVQVPGRRFAVEIVAMRYFGGKLGRFERFDRARGWRLVKRVRLRAESSAGSFARTAAKFGTTLRKGTPVRFILPAAAAAPCYGAGVSVVRTIR